MIEYIEKIQNGKTLSEEDMAGAMRIIMGGKADDKSIETFLRGLSARGETVDEITGAARVLREKVKAIAAPDDALDCCGTGGDGTGTYNISTAVAIVSASCGVPIAKHGNRASSSKSGAADVLEALGITLVLSKPDLEEALALYKFCFLMAPNHHEALKHAATARKNIGERTIFNLLGPLANPAGTRLQLIGVFDRKWVRPMAEVLKKLGTRRAWVVHGADSLDEITTTGPTYIARLDDDGTITEDEITPDDFGLPEARPENLLGGDAEENARALKAVLAGRKGAYLDIVLANTAAVLNIHGRARTLEDGVEIARDAVKSGSALKTLEDYISFSGGDADA